MNIIKRIKLSAFWRWAENKGYNYQERIIVWKSKSCGWNWLMVTYGIRNSKKRQYFPIWNSSNNGSRALIFGFGLWYLEVNYHRKKSFNQNRKLFMRKRLWKFYQLVN